MKTEHPQSLEEPRRVDNYDRSCFENIPSSVGGTGYKYFWDWHNKDRVSVDSSSVPVFPTVIRDWSEMKVNVFCGLVWIYPEEGGRGGGGGVCMLCGSVRE